MTADDELALDYLGLETELVRAVDPKYADHARNDFARYLQRTLSYNQASGGRYTPRCEFGVLYTAGDERTAWAELHARLGREGIEGLPPTMGLIWVRVKSGRYVDFNAPRARDAWG